MGLLDRFLERQLASKTSEIEKRVTGSIIEHVESSLSKASSSPFPTIAPGGRGVKRYQFTQDMVNGGIQNRRKPGSNIAFETLRRFSIQHEVSRACINYRKRQLNGLEWQIVSAEKDDEEVPEAAQREIKAFFKQLGGRGIGYRRFIDRFVEDLLVLDAVSLEKQMTRGATLANLIPLDAATIRLRVDESGATPAPPEAAYVQVIRGAVTAEFTDDEMIYTMMNSRNDSPYGLAPLESLIVVVTSALKSGMYNLAYLTDGNIPEGFYTLPETWQPQQIKDFQEYFDALMSGDETMSSRLKFMPQGEYTNPKKRDDMAFKEFNDWLLKVTCSIFDVDPKEIGFAPETGLGGKGFAEEARMSSDNRGLRPLALFVEEIFTKIIQEDLGYTDLRFDFPSLREKDERASAEVNEILIRSGQRTVDELRTDDGLAPIGVDKPFVIGQPTFIDQESQDAKIASAEALSSQLRDTSAEEEADPEPEGEGEPDKDTSKRDRGDSFTSVMEFRKAQIEELKTFRKYAANRFKSGKAVRPFVSDKLPLSVTEELNEQITKATDIQAVRAAFVEPIKELELANVDTALEVRNRILNIV